MNDMQRLLFQSAHQTFQIDLRTPGFVGDDIGAATPGDNEKHHADAEHQRQPSTLEDLKKIGREVSRIDYDERTDDKTGLPPSPAPHFPDNDETQGAIDEHRRR